MGFLEKLFPVEKISNMTVISSKEAFAQVLKQTSGVAQTRDLKFDIFYQIFAFKGVVDGVGCSTFVANVALAIAELGLTVCVVDTSVLQPVQDVLLHTAYAKGVIEDKDKVDWFDMPYTKVSPLHVSGLNKRISVLSFYGKNRGIVDVLSTNDSDALVDMAITELHGKFDIILMDCCHELTRINTACMQQCQQVIQVWNDTPTVVNNIDNFITNCVTLSCPLDKMRYVICSKFNRDAMGGLDSLIDEYRLRKLTTSYLSEEVSLVLTTGKLLWGYPSRSRDVDEYSQCVIDIVCHILNIDLGNNTAKGTITSNDIMEGKVEGTLTKKMMDENANLGVSVDTNPLHSTNPAVVGSDPGVGSDSEGDPESDSGDMDKGKKKKEKQSRKDKKRGRRKGAVEEEGSGVVETPDVVEEGGDVDADAD